MKKVFKKTAVATLVFALGIGVLWWSMGNSLAALKAWGFIGGTSLLCGIISFVWFEDRRQRAEG